MNANTHQFPTFRQFFHEVHGGTIHPYPWQEDLQSQVMNSGWPVSISVPTGLGKTTAITVWLYELARQIHQGVPRTAPMRLFYVVNRRVVIDQTHTYVNELLAALQSSAHEKLQPVRDALSQVLPPGDDRLIVAASIHGESPDDTSWMRATGPIIVSLTPDQLISRLLMRGYGVSEGTRPIHAGLLGIDRLILIDEPHLSLPAITTLRDQERIQSQAEEMVLPVGNTVLLGATVPSAEKEKSSIEPFDLQKNLEDPSARKRLDAKKTLTIDRLSSLSNAALAKAVVGHVSRLKTEGHQRILVVLNTVGAAQEVFTRLAKNRSKPDDIPIRLLTSRFRPLDKRTDGLEDGPLILVATQTVEVGVDLSFSSVITEACSFAALSQRLGRLNRAGEYHEAAAVLLAPTKKLSIATEAIYGAPQVSAMLELLERQTGGDAPIDVSPRALLALSATAGNSPLEPAQPRSATLHSGIVPIMAQTRPAMTPDIPVSAFVNGPDSEASRDVKVAWRGELAPFDVVDVSENRRVSPVESEYVSVSLSQVRQFLLGASTAVVISDLPEQSAMASKFGPLREDAQGNIRMKNPDDEKWKHLQSVDNIHPGAQLIFASSLGGYTTELGWEPRSRDTVPTVTVAALRAHIKHEVQQSQYRRPTYRYLPVTASLLTEDRIGEETKERVIILLEIAAAYYRASQEGIVDEAITANLVDAANTLIADITDDLGATVDDSIGSRIYDWGVLLPVIVKTEALSHGQKEPSLLAHHSFQVGRWASEAARKAGIRSALTTELEQAGAMHDVGKMDSVFQKSLGVEPDTNFPDGQIHAHQMLAKSKPHETPIRTSRALTRITAPGWRHEIYSVQIASLLNPPLSKLALHLIGTHHGWYRPGFLPPSHASHLTPVPALAMHNMAHADDFLDLNRKYGPWGLAYLESIVRIADWTASASPEILGSHRLQIGSGLPSLEEIVFAVRSMERAPQPEHLDGTESILSGLRDYPLVAWYASAGLLAAAEKLKDKHARVSWCNEAGLDNMPPLTPVLTSSFSLEELVQEIHMSPVWKTAVDTLGNFGCNPIGVKGQKIGPAGQLRDVLLHAEQTHDSVLLGALSDAVRADKEGKVALAIPAFANNSSYPKQAIDTALGGDESIMTTVKSLFDASSGHTISTRDGGFERGAEYAPLANGREGYEARYVRTSLASLAFYGMTALGTLPPSGIGNAKNALTLPLPEKPTSFAELRALVLAGDKRPTANWSAVGNQWLLTASRVYRKSSKTSSWTATPLLRSERKGTWER